MEGRGGCCISRHATAGLYDMSKVYRIMLRFRPIAPKPATGGSVSPKESNESYTKSGRGKRRRTKENNSVNNISKRCTRKRRVLGEEKIVTLPLLPETPDCKEANPKDEKGGAAQSMTPLWLSFRKADDGFMGGGLTPSTTASPAPQAVRSCIIVECVTDTWASWEGLGSTDEERKANLGKDTCPGFISDGLGRVTWTNGAYKEMVGGETAVWLAMKERLPMITYPAFTCRIKVQKYRCGKEISSLTLPCDVWRMNGGGFAWRLDINAALCLGW